MNGQGSLFDNELGPWPANAQPTSRLAALDNYPRSGTQRAKVLVCVDRDERGLTDFQISDRTGIPPSSERPRRVELHDAGLIEPSGELRPSPTGSLATVWIVTAAGHAHAQTLILDALKASA